MRSFRSWRGLDLEFVIRLRVSHRHDDADPLLAAQEQLLFVVGRSRHPDIAVLAACKDSGAAVVAFSPVWRGFLCGAPIDVSALDAKDIRRSMPRFAQATNEANQKLLAPYKALADQAGCSPSQLALAWLLEKAPHIIPIPGTTSVSHLKDDLGASDVKLSTDLIAQLDALINEKTVQGNRYNAQANSEVDTEIF
jgi:aryl-alcohol dehydrogenase-like predicted oxidoreductase